MTDPHPTPEPVEAVSTVGLSPKAIAAAVAPLAAGVLLSALFAVLDFVAASPELLAGLPAWAQVMIGAALAALISGTAAYRARPGVVVPARDSERL